MMDLSAGKTYCETNSKVLKAGAKVATTFGAMGTVFRPTSFRPCYQVKDKRTADLNKNLCFNPANSSKNITYKSRLERHTDLRNRIV